MSESNMTIHSLTTAIRACSNTSVFTDAPDLKPLAENFIRLLDKSKAYESQNAAPVAETCLNLFRIANN